MLNPSEEPQQQAVMGSRLVASGSSHVLRGQDAMRKRCFETVSGETNWMHTSICVLPPGLWVMLNECISNQLLYNKYPQTQELKTTNMNYLMVFTGQESGCCLSGFGSCGCGQGCHVGLRLGCGCWQASGLHWLLMGGPHSLLCLSIGQFPP